MMIDDLYIEINSELKKYCDKVFYLPLNETYLLGLEHKYDLKFPKSYFKFLTEFGFIQDFTMIKQTEDNIKDHLDFLQDTFPDYFPIGISEDYDKLYIIHNNDDEKIYEISYEEDETENSEMKLIYSNFKSYLQTELHNLINNIDNKINNTNKVRLFEFSIHTKNFETIIKLITQKFNCKWIVKQWKEKYYPQNPFKLQVAVIDLDNNQIIVEKDYSEKDDLIFRFEIEEPVNEIHNQSKAEVIKEIFDTNNIKYNVIDSGILENDIDDDDFDDE